MVNSCYNFIVEVVATIDNSKIETGKEEKKEEKKEAVKVEDKGVGTNSAAKLPEAKLENKKGTDSKKNISPELEGGEKSETTNIVNTIDNSNNNAMKK